MCEKGIVELLRRMRYDSQKQPLRRGAIRHLPARIANSEWSQIRSSNLGIDPEDRCTPENRSDHGVHEKFDRRVTFRP